MTIRVLLVDDHPLMRAAFEMTLRAEPDIEVVGEAGNGAEAIVRAREHDPDVILMDIRMPDMDGVEATRELMRNGASPRVLILTTYDTDEHVVEALRAGASGFLLKDVRPAELVHAIRVVADGDALIAPSVTRRLLSTFLHAMPSTSAAAARVGDLTDREIDVLRLVGRGLSNDEIARELFVAETTVRTHLRHILEKLQLRDRVHAVVFAYDAGLVQPNRA